MSASTSIPSKQVSLKPTAGFCVKTVTLDDNKHGLKGLKVFVNIAWDVQVPAPPPGSEESIQRAMKGHDDDQLTGDDWFVPVIVSEPRPDVDKAGKPSLVFDCIYNKSLKSRVLRDPDLKLFLVELALQRIEIQFGIVLSRTIGTPNIVSKGTLAPRTATIPSIDYAKPEVPTSSTTKPLIEEITPDSDQILQPLSWTWRKDGDALQVRILVRDLTHKLVQETALDLEPRRIILSVSTMPSYSLDVDMTLSDAELISRYPQSDVLSLKRQRPFLVDSATSEWRVAERVLILNA
ncbi:hypothetical protein BDZ89DRAFT_1114368 [Hymenopellis radicata]|nr:hypothetical protein BDZ89DRAFT_1114368 [Hymenopellis radicata]